MEDRNLRFLNFHLPFYTLPDYFLTLFYPQACRICDKSVESKTNGFVCEECWRKTHIFNNKEILCQKCSAFLKKGIPTVQTFCMRCEQDEYDLARAVGLYQTALSSSVLALKNEPFLPKRLQSLLISAF